MALTNNLYPPLMPNVIPGFDRTAPCRIYFAVSEYNSKDDIESIQILLTEVKTNKSAFNSTKYPSGIKLVGKFDCYTDQQAKNDFKYYILINPSDLAGGQFKLNQYYKVQLRFTSTEAQFVSLEIPQSITSWINNNLMYFSEWSKATLLRGINLPTLNMTSITQRGSTSGQGVVEPTETQVADGVTNYLLPSPPILFAGTLTFPGNQQDYLKEYEIKMYVSHMIGNDALVLDSGIQYPTTKNKILYNISYSFEDLDYYYYVYITYTTKTLYKQTDRYTIKIKYSEGEDDNRNILIKRVTDSQDGPNDYSSMENQSLYGYIHLNLSSDVEIDEHTGPRITTFPKDATLILRRSSSKDNFNTWEDLYTFRYPFRNIYWRDITVENGIFYKYGFYRNNSLTTAHIYRPSITPPEVCMFEDNFLVGNNVIFKIAFNPSISSFRYNTTESQQVTLGSQFPFIKRNAKNYYRTFSISGLISSLSNEYWWQDAQVNSGSLQQNYQWNHSDPGTRRAGPPHYIQFTSKEDIYNNVIKLKTEYTDSDVLEDWKNRWNITNPNSTTMFNLYKKLEQKEKYSDYLNPLYERMFREKLYKFLYDGKVKLFKSPTEGNILIRLTDISFEPLNELGRVLYSFSATATEVDEANFKNYLKYGIVTDKFIDLVSYGQMYSWSPMTEVAKMTNGTVTPQVTPSSTGDVSLVVAERYVKDGKLYGSS